MVNVKSHSNIVHCRLNCDKIIYVTLAISRSWSHIVVLFVSIHHNLGKDPVICKCLAWQRKENGLIKLVHM